jgi:hypothetical protein
VHAWAHLTNVIISKEEHGRAISRDTWNLVRHVMLLVSMLPAILLTNVFL